MGDALGIIYIENDEDEEEFVYYTHKAVEPDYERIRKFVDTYQARSERCIIHGRLATAGARDIKAAHPIGIECNSCDIDWVVHNGVITSHELTRREQEREGHTFQTNVDSEVIAHEYESVPASVDSLEPQFHQPAYILGNKDALYINTSFNYRLTSEGRMGLSYRQFAPEPDPEAEVESYSQVIMTPTGGK